MPFIPDFIRQRAPLATDDRTQFYFKDKTWLDEVASRRYRSDDDSPGAAVWTDITPAGGGSSGPVHWNDVEGKPATFPPLGHAHGNPNDIPTLPITKVDSLQQELDAKAAAAAVQAQLDGKQPILGFTPQDVAQKGQANGYAGLGADGKVPSGQLPASGANPFTTVKKSADQTNATTTLANVTGMLLPVAASTDYLIEGFFRMRSSLATAGFKLALDVPTGAEVSGFYTHVLANTGTVTAGGQRADAVQHGVTSGVDTINVDVMVYACWEVVNGANAGNAQLMFAAEVAATVTMRAKSALRSMVV